MLKLLVWVWCGFFNFGRHYSPERVMPELMPCSNGKMHQTTGTQFTYGDATHLKKGPMCIPAQAVLWDNDWLPPVSLGGQLPSL